MRDGEKLIKILDYKEHVGCIFWESPELTILLVANPNVADLIKQAEQILKIGYYLSGGIQLIRRDDGEYNGSATFILD